MRQPPPTEVHRGLPEIPATRSVRQTIVPRRVGRGIVGALVVLLGLWGSNGPSGPASPASGTLGSTAPSHTGSASALATPTLTAGDGIVIGDDLTQDQRLSLFEQAWALVRDKYVYSDYHGLDWQAIHTEFEPKIQAASNTFVVYKLMKQMIDQLDDGHSWFADPDEAAWKDAHMQAHEELVGHMGLVGTMLGEAFRVLEVAPGSPADQAGIHRLDIIQAVDGTPLLNEDDAQYLLSGAPEDMSILLVQTPGQAPRHVHVTRTPVEYTFQPQATIWPGTHIAYLDIPTFDNDGVANKVHDQLALLAGQRPQGLIIDLRENSGGLVYEMRDTLALFINGGRIGYDATRENYYTITLARKQMLASLVGKPIVVLIDNHSESAAEVFAAAMRIRGAGIALGTNTAGNVEIIYPHPMPGGSRLYLAEARYLLIDGTSPEGVGIHPDILMDVPWYDHPPAEDPQVLAAIKYIQRHH